MPEVCALCGSADHNVSHCPWKGRTMRYTLILCAALLSGCGTLSLNFDFAGSYRSDQPLAKPLGAASTPAPAASAAK